MDNSHDIKVLNGLIETTLDSADGYAGAANDVKSGKLNLLFHARADERRSATALLQQRVRSLGGKPEDDGTVLGSAHRMFVNLKASLASNDNKAVVDEVERGEDHIKSKFESAMKDDKITPHTMSLISDAYASVRSGHDQMRDLKHSMHG